MSYGMIVEDSFIFFYHFSFDVVHDGILIHTLAMLSLWCHRFSSQVPTQLINWFKVCIGLF